MNATNYVSPSASNVSIVAGLQRLFYLVPPSESMFKEVHEVPDYIIEAIPTFLMLVVVEIVVLWLQGKPLPRIDDSITSITAGFISKFPALFMKGMEFVTYLWIYENYRLVELPWDSVWTWIVAGIAYDFGYYWVHRFAHEINFMWAAHQVHHSSEDYNLTTALRQSILQQYSNWPACTYVLLVTIIAKTTLAGFRSRGEKLTDLFTTKLIFYLPIGFFVPPSVFLVHAQFNLLYQFWIHTETIGWLGPLEYIINTPSAHRVHHGRNRYCIDNNYAGVLIIWDILFGTYAAERTDDISEKVVYGLVHPIESRNAIYVQLCHWQWVITCMSTMREGLIDKLKTLLYGPGWEPGKPRMGDINDIPDIQYPQPKYQTHAPTWFSVYALFHFLIISMLNQLTQESRTIWSTESLVVAASFIAWSLTSIGSLFDQRWYSPIVELARCCAVVTYLLKNMALLHDSIGYSPTVGLLSVFIASALLWLTVSTRSGSTSKRVD